MSLCTRQRNWQVHPFSYLASAQWFSPQFLGRVIFCQEVSWSCDILSGNKIQDTSLFVDYICILLLVFLFRNGGKHKSFINTVLVWSYLTAALTYFTILCLGGFPLVLLEYLDGALWSHYFLQIHTQCPCISTVQLSCLATHEHT
jgi:hypothetical protein